MDRTLSRSVPHLPRYQSVSPARSPRLDTRRFLSLHSISQPTTHISYIDGAPTRGINSYHVHHSPSPKRSYKVHMISSKASHHLIRSTRSLSATDLNSSHVYSSLDDLIVQSKRENDQRGNVASCEDIFHKKPFFPDITHSESGVSVGEWEEGSTYGGEEDNLSQRSFGSSSAFFDGTIDSELEKFDSDNCSGHEHFRDLDQDDARANRRLRNRRSSIEVAIPDGFGNSPLSSYGESKRKELMSRDFEKTHSRFGVLNVHIPTSDPPTTKAGNDHHQNSFSKCIASTPLAQSTPHVSPRGLGEQKLSVRASWMADYPLEESSIEIGSSKLDGGRAFVDMDLSDNDLQSLCRINDCSFSDDNFSDLSNATITSPDLRKPKLVKKASSSKPKTSSGHLSSMPRSDEYVDEVGNCHQVYPTFSDMMGSDGDRLGSPDGRSISGAEWWALYNIESAKKRKALGRSNEPAGLGDGSHVVFESRRENTDSVRLPLITPGKHGQEKLRRASQTSPLSDRSSPGHSSTEESQTDVSDGVGGDKNCQNDNDLRTQHWSINFIADSEFAHGEKMTCFDDSLDTVVVNKSIDIHDNGRLTKATIAETDLRLNIDSFSGDKVSGDSVANELTQRPNRQGERYLLDSYRGEIGLKCDVEEEPVGHVTKTKQMTVIFTEIEDNDSSWNGLIGSTRDVGNTRGAIITHDLISPASPLHHVNSWTNGGACSERHDGIDHVGVSKGEDKDQPLQQPGLTVGLTGRADTGMSTENTNTDGFIDSRLAVCEGGEIPLLTVLDNAAVVNCQCVDETKNIHKGCWTFSVAGDKIVERISSEPVSRTESRSDVGEIRDSCSVLRFCEDSTLVLSTRYCHVTADCDSVVTSDGDSVVVCIDSCVSSVDARVTCNGRIGQQGSHGPPFLRPVDESIKERRDAGLGDTVICQAENSSVETGVLSVTSVYDSNVVNHPVEIYQRDSRERGETGRDFKHLDSEDVISTTVSDGSIVISARSRDPIHEAVNAIDLPFLSVTTLTQETGGVVATNSSNPTLCQATHGFISPSGVSLDGVKTAPSDSVSHCTDIDYTRTLSTLPNRYAGTVQPSQSAMQHSNRLDNLHAQLSLISAVDINITTNDAVDSYQVHAKATNVTEDVYDDSGDYCYLSESADQSGTYYSYSIQVHSDTDEDSVTDEGNVEISPREQYDNEDGLTTQLPTYSSRRHHHYSFLKSKSSSLWTLEEETESMLDAQSPKPSPKRSLPTVPSEEENSGDECSPLGQASECPDSSSVNNYVNSNIVVQDQLLGYHSTALNIDSRHGQHDKDSFRKGEDIQHELLLPIGIPSVPLHTADMTWSVGQTGGNNPTTTSLCGPIPVNSLSPVVSSALEVLSSSLQQFSSHEFVGDEDDLFIVEDERDYCTNNNTSRRTRDDAALSWNDDEVSESSSRIHDFDQEISLVSSSVSPSPSDVSEGLLYTCVGTAQVKHAHSAFDYDNPVSPYTGNIHEEQMREKLCEQDMVMNLNDKEDLFERLLEEFNQSTSPLADLGEVIFCEVGKDGTQLKPLKQLDNLYKAFTNEDSEKKQNHVCIVIEDDNMSTYRLKRYLKKSHTKRTAGKNVIKFLSKLGCVSETASSPELSPKRFQSKHGELVFGTDNMPSSPSSHVVPRPVLLNSTCFQDLNLLTRSAQGPNSTTSSNQSLDSLKSRADSAYSSFSESMVGELTSPRNPSISLLSPACPLSSTSCVFHESPFSPNLRSPDSVYSSTSSDKIHYWSGHEGLTRSGETSSLNTEVMTALSDVFDQLDVCNDEIDTALLNRLRHCHTRADVNSK